jgi:hypothetical protein
MEQRALAVLPDIIVQVWLFILCPVLMVHIQKREALLPVTYVQQATHVLMFLILQTNVTMESTVLLGMPHVRYSVKLIIASIARYRYEQKWTKRWIRRY